MIDVDHLWGRWGNILVLILCIIFLLFFYTCHFLFEAVHMSLSHWPNTEKNFGIYWHHYIWFANCQKIRVILRKCFGCLVVYLFSQTLLWRFMFLSQRNVDKKIRVKNRESVMLIWVHDMWHHYAPYTSIPAPWWSTRSQIFIFIFKVFLLQLCGKDIQLFGCNYRP